MTTTGNSMRPSGTLTAVAALLVAAGTFVVFSPGLKNDFIGWDDQFYITENPFIASLSASTIASAFTRFYFKSYTPLTHLSHAIDYRFWGLDPRGHHLMNILIHAANGIWVLLLMTALFRAVQKNRLPGEGGPAGPGEKLILIGGIVAALFFAWHPLRVESVACASSRKDLLSGFFAIPSLLAYLHYAGRRGEPGARRWYLVSLLLFILALFAKGSVMVLPGLLFIIDFIVEGSPPREARQVWRLAREKIPFALFALGGAVAAYIASEMEVPNQAVRAQVNQVRPLMVLYNYGFYVVKTFWPLNLVAIYDPPPAGTSLLIMAIFVVLTGWAVVLWRKGRFAVPLAWGSYLILLSPMAGIVPASIQIIANRYAYVATLGFALLAGWLFVRVWRSPRHPAVRPVALVATLSILLALAMVSADSLRTWRDAEAVWTRTIRVSPASPLAHIQMGVALEERADYPGALAHFYNALEIYPDYPEGFCNLGGVLSLMGDTANAERALARAVALTPESHFVYTNLGNVRLIEKRTGEAIALYRHALSIKPADYVTAYDLGFALLEDRQYADAEAALRHSLAYNPNYRDAWYLLGVVLGRHRGDKEGSLKAFQAAARLGHMEARKVLLGMGVEW